MSISIKRFLLSVSLLCAISFTTFAQNFPKAATPARLVNDFANMLSKGEQNALEAKLSAFSDTTSTQIAIVTVDDLQGMSPSSYATELAHKWGIGVKGKDNGVLILLKPKTLLSKGEVFIAVGYGLEGAIPDAMASRIVRNILIPAFKQNQIYKGLNGATDVLMSLATGEYTATKQKNSEEIPTPLLVFGFVFIMSILSSIRAKKNGGQTYDSHRSSGGIPPIIFFPPSRGSGWGSSGSDFGGGGFGGFSGGGFGGGGAGGSW